MNKMTFLSASSAILQPENIYIYIFFKYIRNLFFYFYLAFLKLLSFLKIQLRSQSWDMILVILNEKQQFTQPKNFQQTMPHRKIPPCSELDFTRAKFLAVLNQISLTLASRKMNFIRHIFSYSSH